MALSQLMTNAGGANGLTALAKQVVTIHVNAVLGTPGAHLGNTRSTATTQPKVTANANRSNVDQTRHQREKINMVKRRNLRRKGNGHHRIDPGLSQGMQTVGRRHQFLSGRRAHHNVRVGIEGNHDRLTAMGTGITDKRFDEFLVSTVNAVEHANGD